MNAYLRAQWSRLFGLNLSPLTPLLYVGGRFDAAQWPAMHALGIRAVLSLQDESEDSFAGPPPERTLRVPVVDFTAPTVAQIEDGVRFITASHADNLPVLIHCHGGVGRAPLFAAAYLMASEGTPYLQALARVRAARPIIGPNAGQIRSLRDYERHLREQARPAGEAVV